MKVFRYYTLYRPPSPGSVPPGFVFQRTIDSRPYISEAGHTVWGIVDYDRRLTQKEIRDYELTPADMVKMPIEVDCER